MVSNDRLETAPARFSHTLAPISTTVQLLRFDALILSIFTESGMLLTPGGLALRRRLGRPRLRVRERANPASTTSPF